MLKGEEWSDYRYHKRGLGCGEVNVSTTIGVLGFGFRGGNVSTTIGVWVLGFWGGSEYKYHYRGFGFRG